MAEAHDASVGGLVRNAIDDVRDLFREELALAKAELREEMSRATAVGTRFGTAAVLLWFAVMFALVTAALGLSSVFGWPAWAGFGLLAFVLLVIGGGLAMSGRRSMREIRILPRTTQTMKENFR